MTYQERIPLYNEVESIRKRPLIVYATRSSAMNSGSMSLDSIPELCEQLLRIDSKSKKIDILIASQGGDAIAAWRIISLLKERFDEIDVLVPFIAQSAATILSFGANHIVMHPFACLGPIDPQITIQEGNQPFPKTFSAEDIQAYLEFVKCDLKLDDDGMKHPDSVDEINSNVLNHLSEELKPTQMGLVKKSMKLSRNLARKLLSSHMFDDDKITEIIEKFNSSTHHGYTVGRKEALDSGLPVVSPSKKLEVLMWSIWADLSKEMHCDVPIDPMKQLISNPEDKTKLEDGIRSLQPYALTTSLKETIAVVESRHMESHYEANAFIMAAGNGINITFNVLNSSIGWVRGGK